MAFTLVKAHALLWRSLMLAEGRVAAIGAMRFSVCSFCCALFLFMEVCTDW